MMDRRINIETVHPDAYKAMINLAGIVSKTSITPIQKHLISVRASQINSCSFCINMHTKEALNAGETQQRLFLLSAWKETDIFSDEEKAILALTEEVTLIHQHGVSDTTYQNAQKFFSERTISEIIMAIVMINGWNRIAVTSRTPFKV